MPFCPLQAVCMAALHFVPAVIPLWPPWRGRRCEWTLRESFLLPLKAVKHPFPGFIYFLFGKNNAYLYAYRYIVWVCYVCMFVCVVVDICVPVSGASLVFPRASWSLRLYRSSFYRWCGYYRSRPPHLSSCAFWGSNSDMHACTLRTSDWPCFSRLVMCFHLIRPFSYSVRTIPRSSLSSLSLCWPHPFCYSLTNAHVSTTSLMTFKFKWVLQIY